MSNYLPAFKNNKNNLYVVYWAGYVLLLSSIQGLPSHDFTISLINEVISLPPKIIFVYLVTQIFMPRYFLQQRMGYFMCIYLVSIVAFGLLQRVIDNTIILEYFLTHWTKEKLLSVPPLLYSIIKLQFVVTIPFTIKLFYHWTQERSHALEIQTDKMQTELQLLRAQFHPHFMFNVLNSLYSKILSKSDESAEIVLKISDMLRYAVYESQEKVNLQDEVNYLQNYIELQQLRFDNALDISFAVKGDPSSYKIEPFLIMPFIENSFKYCMNSETSSGWITVYMEVIEDWLQIKIENSHSRSSKFNETKSVQKGGQGLQQVKRRLDLLYPDDHTLKISENQESYFVYLKVKLHALHG